MALVPWRPQESLWNPFAEMERIQQEMNQLFSHSLSRIPAKRTDVFAWGPAVDIHEEKKSIRVKVDLPGMDKKDIDASVHGNTLVIKGEKKQESETKKKGFYRAERSWGSFHRAVPLPADVDAKKTKAAYKNGVLDLTFPKKSGAKKHALVKINVK